MLAITKLSLKSKKVSGPFPGPIILSLFLTIITDGRMPRTDYRDNVTFRKFTDFSTFFVIFEFI